LRSPAMLGARFVYVEYSRQWRQETGVLEG